MIVGTGVDIVEIGRVARAIENRRFRERVYTPAEQTYCDARGSGRAASYAARWAAKEAVMKALGTGLSGGSLTEIEIERDEKGCPGVRLTGEFAARAAALGASRIWLSLSHAKEYAVASCNIEEESVQ
ncbi:MAG: holo-ACP synthase [Schwartzia sp.]|nr:holo-ACP synthase [Schwartzia sp. (in: firmicutes)]